jgi:hypothetical protein
MNKPDREEPAFPSLEEVREWRRLMDESEDHCIRYSMSAEGLDHILRMAEAERHYGKLGLL